MKIRCGFVSNSSSSSFLIDKYHLSAEQIEKIFNHSEEGKKLNIDWSEDAWSIHENDQYIMGHAYPDNFDMEKFLEAIGVKEEHIEWSEWNNWDKFNENKEENK